MADITAIVSELRAAFTVGPVEPGYEAGAEHAECNKCGAYITLRDYSPADPPVFCDECAQELAAHIPALLDARDAALAETRTLRSDTLDMAGNVIQAAGRGQAQFGIPGKVMTEPEAAQWAAEMLWTMAQAERITNTTTVGGGGS